MTDKCSMCGRFVEDIFTHVPQCGGGKDNRSQSEINCRKIHRRAEQNYSTHEISNDVDLSMEQVRRHLKKECTCETAFLPKHPEHGRWVRNTKVNGERRSH